ncbi:hypothetical protein KJ975_03355 [Myxococcota bacterium]|nr:hypothetical protein [Myxococcota bacterium]
MKRLIMICLLAATTMACDAVIGDSCSANVDCSSSGNRLCDTSMPGGYCTVEGCSAGSCPDGAVCVAFFPPATLFTPCDPATEDRLGSDTVTDDCADYEVCLSSGFCAQASLERRFCMQRCGGSGDCRDKYTCRTTGELGSQRVPRDTQDYATVGISRFCVAKE